MSQNRHALAAFLVVASLVLVAHAGPALAGIVPADRATVWNPGIPGGIPADADATRPATVWLPSGNPYNGYSVDPALGNNSTDATSAINNAIGSAGAVATASSRKIVLLAPGTYRTNGIININRSYVTLRGAGAGKTIINHQTTSDYAAIYIGRTVGDYSTTPVVSVVGGAAKGAAQITVADASGFAVGDILQIDQLEDGSQNGPTGWVWRLDSWWSLRSPYADFSGGGGLQGKFPDSPNGYRPISQRIEVLAKSGNTLTIYDPATGRGAPLHVAFPSTMDPEVWRAAGGTTDVARYAGLESLTVWSAAASGDAKDMVLMNGAAYCWIKNIETDGTKNTWAGRHIHLQNAVYRAEVRGSYSHNSSNYNQGSNAYGIIYSGSECLIEDNIVRELNKPVLGETSGGGNVIAYNYVDEAIIGSLTNTWQETAIDMSHGSFCHSDLFEGNDAPNIGVDSTHGNNGFGVIFRNYVTGRNSSGGTNTYLRAIFSDGWSREMTSIGNVLGSSTYNPTYQFLTPSTGVDVVYGGVSSIYLLGSNAWELGTGNKPGADYLDNGQAASLFYRHLDWDSKTKAQYVNPSNPVTTLPDSLYLKSKPAFFGSLPWPWVDPSGATKVYTLPAKARYDGKTVSPALSINDVAVAEGNSGTTTATFTVTLAPAASGTVTVNYATANGTATAGSDYTATSGTLTFAAGQTSKTIAVAIAGDTTIEADETFTVTLSGASGATISRATGTGTIRNDDFPSLSIADASVNEGNSGTTNAVFTVTLSTTTPQTVTVNYATANGTATAGSDYNATTGSLTFSPGQTSRTISVAVIGDTTVEPNETFTVTLSSPSAATLARAQATGTIVNDDSSGSPLPTLSIGDASTAEGDCGQKNLVFTVTLSAASAKTVTVAYATANGTASAGTDYVATSGTLTFNPSATSGTIAVPVKGDLSVEANETFTVNLTSPVNATLADAQAVGTITNDDRALAAGQQFVTWTRLVGTTACGPSVTRTASGSGWTAGASSTLAIVPGDGYAEFAAPANNVDWMAGLSRVDADAGNASINFAVYVQANGTASAVESGVNKASLGSYKAGDVFRVEMLGGNVRYLKNGVVGYQHAAAVVYPLVLDSSISTSGATVRRAVLAGTLIAAPQPVTWRNLVGTSATGPTLTKTSSVAGWNAGASSNMAIASGEGWAEFVAVSASTNWMAGLSHGDSGVSYADIDFAIDATSSGVAYAYEAGVNKGSLGSYKAGDVFRVEYRGGNIRYRKNGVVLLQHAAKPTYPLLLDSAISSSGGRISNAVLEGTLTTVQ